MISYQLSVLLLWGLMPHPHHLSLSLMAYFCPHSYHVFVLTLVCYQSSLFSLDRFRLNLISITSPSSQSLQQRNNHHVLKNIQQWYCHYAHTMYSPNMLFQYPKSLFFRQWKLTTNCFLSNENQQLSQVRHEHHSAEIVSYNANHTS